LTKKIAITAGALTLTATGIAAAASPEAATDGLAKAAEQVGVELPATKDAHPGAQNDNEAKDTDDEATDADATEVEAPKTAADAGAEGTGPVDNHGAEVSAVAHTELPTGRQHGEAVSEVARQNHGADARAAAQHGKP
jgi:hypothetical protein